MEVKDNTYVVLKVACIWVSARHSQQLDNSTCHELVRPTRPLDMDTFVVGGLQKVTHSYLLYTSGISGTDD